jgi:hypothetical protein
VALDFLARPFGLDKLPKLLRLGLQALRRPVEKGVNGVLDQIIKLAQKAWQGAKKGGAAVAQAGQQALGAVKGFFGVRTEFDAGPEHHSLYFQKRGAKTVLIIESTPTQIEEFLNNYAVTHTKPEQVAKIGAIRKHLTAYQPIYDKIDVVGADSDAARLHHTELLELNVTLSSMLKELISYSDTPIVTAGEHFKLEGLTGTFASMVQIKTDELAPDHQPQAALFQWAYSLAMPAAAGAASKPLFGAEMARRAVGEHADGAYTINIGAVRHKLGRTYLNEGKRRRKEFIAKVTPLLVATSDPQEQRNIVVDAMQEELRDDVQAMWLVVRQHPGAWADIDALTGLSVAEKDRLKRNILHRIEQGEREIANQPMNTLRN